MVTIVHFPFDQTLIEYAIIPQNKMHRPHIYNQTIFIIPLHCLFSPITNRPSLFSSFHVKNQITLEQLRNMPGYKGALQQASNQPYPWPPLNQIQYNLQANKIIRMERPSPRTNQPSNALSQRTSLRLSTLHAETLTSHLFASQNNSPIANSFRERLPKFRTQQSSLEGKQKGMSAKLHFPQLIVREGNPSQYTLHSLKVEEMKSKVAKTSYILDSIIRIFHDDPGHPTNPSKEKKPQPLDDFNEFLEPGKERRAKRPKIIQNEMTRIFLSSKEKQRKTKPLPIQHALSQKLEATSFRNSNPCNPSRMANNEFLPEGKEQLNKLRTLRFSKH